MSKLISRLIVVLFTSLICAGEIDPIFVLQRSFCSAALKSMGDAGIAFPSDLSAGLINPALVNVYRNNITDIHGSIITGFGRDSLYNKSIIPSGISYSAQDGSAALFYRYLSSDNHLLHHEITLNLSGMFSPSSDEQGQVDFGVNLRYGFMSWKQQPLQELERISRPRNSTDQKLYDTTLLETSEFLSRQERQSDLLLDIGFFQPHIIPNVDFALTLRNLSGYTWNSFKPYKTVIQDSLSSDSLIIDSTYFVNSFKKTRGWIHARYRILAAGITYHAVIKEGSFNLNLPLDIEIMGLFDKKTKTRFVFKGGVEALIVNRFALRLGYSRAPGILLKGVREIKNLNFFTGGGGIHIEPLNFNFYITPDTFGTTLSFDY